MRRLVYILFFVFVLPFSLSAQAKKEDDGSLVKWLSFKEAQELNKKQPKPFIIDVYTDWCGWCKHMMKTTYAQPELASYINAYFYPVKFDAETRDTIEYLGVKYYKRDTLKRTTHQLAYKLLGNNLSYPSTIFSNNNFQFNLLSAGYLEVKKIEPLLIYTLENVFRTTGYEDFQKYYDKAFDESKPDTSKIKLKKHTMNEALKLSEKKPKKLFISIYTNWCNGCRVMNKSTFPDPKITAELEKDFYFVDLNAETRDTINFANQAFINNGTSGPFHPFVMALSKNNVTLPTNVIMNEKNEIIDVLPFYLTPETLEPILDFYGKDIYKTTKWEDYKKKRDEKNNSVK